jgi:hypothetical protein
MVRPEKKLKELPDVVVEQFELVDVDGLVGIECTFRNTYSQEVRLFLPSSVTQIKDFGDFIGIYADKFFFKIPKEMKKYNIEYVFIRE